MNELYARISESLKLPVFVVQHEKLTGYRDFTAALRDEEVV